MWGYRIRTQIEIPIRIKIGIGIPQKIHSLCRDYERLTGDQPNVDSADNDLVDEKASGYC